MALHSPYGLIKLELMNSDHELQIGVVGVSLAVLYGVEKMKMKIKMKIQVSGSFYWHLNWEVGEPTH